MPNNTYEDEIRAAIETAGANQGAYKRYQPYNMPDEGMTEADAGEKALLARVPQAVVPLDVAAIAQGILRAQGKGQ